MTLNESRLYEAGKALASSYASTYGTAEAMTLLRKHVVESVGHAVETAGMCDALLERAQREAR